MRFSRKMLAVPYIIFLVCFVVLPLLVLFYYAFTGSDGHFTINNLLDFFTDPNTTGTLVYSMMIALMVTIVCLAIAYPLALVLSFADIPRKDALVMVFVMTMWINFTLRVTALKEILTFFEGNLAYHPLFNTVIGMTYDFLPFMILPLYNSISRMDRSLLEAASDLGSSKLHAFMKVTLPLSVPGIIAGISMVFLPAMTNYVVLDMLYNSTYIMGSLIGSYFSAYDWHNGSMIALVLLVIICIFTLLSEGGEDNTRGGALL